MRITNIKRGKPYLFTDVNAWGGKGDNLLKLSEVFNVPQGFVISSETYTDWLGQTRLDRATTESLKKSPEEASRAILESYLRTDFPREMITRLSAEFGKVPKPLAVRSSSIAEDGANSSFAGQHESVLGVTNFNQFLMAIKEVYASLFSARAIQYRKSKGDLLYSGTGDAIAVVVQQMIDPVVSGVAYSPSPSNLEEILVESTWGLCTSIVDGRPCDIFRVIDTVTGDIIEDISPKKVEMDKYDAKSRSVKTIPVPEAARGRRSLVNNGVLEVAKTVKSIERAYGMPMDMEFAFDKDATLYVLQARPLTGIVQSEKEVTLPDVPANKVLARSRNTRNQGIFEGPVVVVRGVDHVNRQFDIDGDIVKLNQQFKKGYILLTPEVPPQLEQYVSNAKAMYATECGTTGHAAAIAVEKGIIYLGRGNSNVQNLLGTIRSGTKLGIAASRDEGILYLA